jgi:hypothetical protein
MPTVDLDGLCGILMRHGAAVRRHLQTRIIFRRIFSISQLLKNNGHLKFEMNSLEEFKILTGILEGFWNIPVNCSFQ